MPGVEVERKWLVPEAPADALAAPSERIRQGYLTVGRGGAETRVRCRGERFFLTTKSGNGLVRAEHEVELAEDQFDGLWPATDGARLEKIRHKLPSDDGRMIELDVYEGTLAGLIVAEVEFDDPWGAEAFVVPYWFGREVTTEPGYRNQNLALRGLPAPGSP
jgi:CYTH domain-containing protein